MIYKKGPSLPSKIKDQKTPSLIAANTRTIDTYICNLKMSAMKNNLKPVDIDGLRNRLTNATVYTPESTGYKESLVRWSDTGLKLAV